MAYTDSGLSTCFPSCHAMRGGALKTAQYPRDPTEVFGL